MKDFWGAALGFGEALSAIPEAERIRKAREELKEVQESFPGWKRSLAHWHMSGVAASDPIRAAFIATLSTKVMGEPQPPRGDPWYSQYLRDSTQVLLFVLQVVEFLRSRVPGYPFLDVVHRSRMLPHELMVSFEWTSYDPNLNCAKLMRMPSPGFLGNKWPDIERHINMMASTMGYLDSCRDMKLATRELANNDSLKTELQHITERYDTHVHGLEQRITRFVILNSRARKLRDSLYAQASPQAHRYFHCWRSIENLVQGVYAATVSLFVGNPLWRWKWPSDRFDDVEFMRGDDALRVRIRTTNAPELLLVDIGDVLALDFSDIDDLATGLYRLTSITKWLGTGSCVLSGAKLPQSEYVVKKWTNCTDW